MGVVPQVDLTRQLQQLGNVDADVDALEDERLSRRRGADGVEND
jgi:hypothetical protein